MPQSRILNGYNKQTGSAARFLFCLFATENKKISNLQLTAAREKHILKPFLSEFGVS